MANVGKYTSPMDGMGLLFIVLFPLGILSTPLPMMMENSPGRDDAGGVTNAC